MRNRLPGAICGVCAGAVLIGALLAAGVSAGANGSRLPGPVVGAVRDAFPGATVVDTETETEEWSELDEPGLDPLPDSL